MTHLLTLAVGLAVGAGGMYAAHLVWREQHNYRRVRLEATRVDKLYATADHEFRLRRRREASAVELREWVGDLLDVVAAKQRIIDSLTRPRHRRRSPVPTYGAEPMGGAT